ncbi:hypothetical protein [Streptomyces mayteni]
MSDTATPQPEQQTVSCHHCTGMGEIRMTAVITSPGDGQTYHGLTSSQCGLCGGTGQRTL